MLGWVVYTCVLCIPPPSNVALVITYQKKTFERGSTFMRQIYYACITYKKLQPKFLILSFEFQNLHFYNNEKFSKKNQICI